MKLHDEGVSVFDIDGIFITHEHDDHIKAAGEMAQFVPVYSHPKTLEAICQRFRDIPLDNLRPIEAPLEIGDLTVSCFDTSHDAVHPYGYSLSDGQSKFTLITDTGYISDGAFKHAKGSDIVMLESNHDLEMLKRGKYPEYLKRRILSNVGHLSNYESALTVLELIKNGAKKIMLAHISEENNLPELAFWTVDNFLRDKGVENGSYHMKVAQQRASVRI
jgi:phosphoribosyl 1,2-cyclic phosphodiesterase